jgi:hypothetical protein
VLGWLDRALTDQLLIMMDSDTGAHRKLGFYKLKVLKVSRRRASLGPREPWERLGGHLAAGSVGADGVLQSVRGRCPRWLAIATNPHGQYLLIVAVADEAGQRRQ